MILSIWETRKCYLESSFRKEQELPGLVYPQLTAKFVAPRLLIDKESKIESAISVKICVKRKKNFPAPELNLIRYSLKTQKYLLLYFIYWKQTFDKKLTKSD